MSKLCLQRKIEKHYLREINTFNKFCCNSTKCYMRINKQLIKLVYNDVKKLAQSLMCSNGSRMYFDAKIEKLYLCEIITFNKFCATPHKCYMQINKQLINACLQSCEELSINF